MDFAAVFKFLIEKFSQEKIEFAIIGGFALQFSGITRATRDVDLLVLAQNAQKITEIMLAHGYKLIHKSEDVLNFVSDNPQLGRVDFLLAYRKYALVMLKRAQEQEVFGKTLKIKAITVEDQVGLKVQSSSNNPKRLTQDMADIESLISANYTRLDIPLLKEYFGLFEREGELEQILERVKNAQ